MIGARLKLARNAAGLSLRGLAERIDGLVTAQAIGKYERDLMMPGSSVLLALSKALAVPPDYLLSQREISLSGLEFRKAPGAGAREEKAVQARVLEQMDRHVALEEALNLSTLRWRPPLDNSAPIGDPNEGMEAANTLRAKWHLGQDPILSMTELLEEHGIKVIALDLPARVFGSKLESTLANGHVLPAVIVNRHHTGERQRFTLAHELGHLVLHFQKGIGKQGEEKATDRFAGAFLVPEEELRRTVGTHRTDISLGELIELKRKFLVSLQTLVVRLRQTGILTDADANRHWEALKERGYFNPPYPEPEPVPSEHSHRMHRLALRAVAEGALSESRAAELLGVPARILVRWLDEGAHADAT